MKLRIISLIVFSVSFMGLYLLVPGTILHLVCAFGIILTIWIDFFSHYSDEITKDAARRKASTFFDTYTANNAL